MAPFENVRIDYLQEKDLSPGTKVQQNELNTYFDDKFFEDLKNLDCKIKKSGELYIFEQKDLSSSRLDDNGQFQINKFYVKESVLKDYIRNQERQEKANLAGNNDLLNFFSAIHTSQNLSSLREGINDNIEGIEDDIERISRLIEEYNKYTTNKNMKLTNNTKDGRETRRNLKNEAKFRVKLLLGMKKDILKQKNPTVYLKDINQCVRDMPVFAAAWQEANNGGRGYVPRILHDRKSIEKYNIELKDEIIESQEINRALRDIALMRLHGNDQKRFKKYLKDVISGKILHPAQDPFYADHAVDFAYIKEHDHTAYTKYSRFMDEGQITGYCTRTVSGAKRTCSTNKSGLEQGGDMVSDALAKLGLIDENDPKQKKAWSNAAKIGLLGLGAFALYKIFTTKWKTEKGMNKRHWLMGAAGGVLALKNADKLKSWYKDAFGTERPTSENLVGPTNLTEEMKDNYLKPALGITNSLGTIPINTLISEKIVYEDNGGVKIDYDKYKEYVKNNISDQTEQNRLIESINGFESDEAKADKGFKLYNIGSIEDLQKISGDDNKKTLLDSPKIAEFFESLASPVNSDLAKEGLKPKNAKAWYEMSKEFTDKNNDEQIIKWMKAGLLELVVEKSYSAKEMIDNKNLNPLEKTMNGFNGIKFEGYDDLFGAVKLTEFIKETFKNKSTATNEYSLLENKGPFHSNFFTLGNIEFNNTERYEIWKNETNTVNGRRLKDTLAEMSPTLDDHKGEYIKYLNKRWRDKDNL